jgi:hypothetical protein
MYDKGDTVEFYCDRVKRNVKGYVHNTSKGAFNNGGVGKTYFDSADIILIKSVPLVFEYGAPVGWLAGQNEVPCHKMAMTKIVITEKYLCNVFS